MNIFVDESPKVIKDDIIKSIKIFEEKLGKNSEFFSYPFESIVLNLKI